MYGAPFLSHHLVLPTDSTPGRGLLHIYSALDKKRQARIILVVNIEKVMADDRGISGRKKEILPQIKFLSQNIGT